MYLILLDSMGRKLSGPSLETFVCIWLKTHSGAVEGRSLQRAIYMKLFNKNTTIIQTNKAQLFKQLPLNLKLCVKKVDS